jgi:transposase
MLAGDLAQPSSGQWLADQALPEDERDTVDGALRQIDFLTEEITKIEGDLARHATNSTEARRLMTVPGVGLITAVAFLGQVGEIDRFQTPGQLVGYLGLDPRVRQSGNSSARLGRISKEGSTLVRHVLVESAHTAIRSPGPLRAFFERVRARRGHAVAIVAVARKMTVLFWHLLTREEDHAYQMPLVTNKKLRKVELAAGAPPRHSDGNLAGPNREERRKLERQSAQAAQAAYERNVADWHHQQQQQGKKAPMRA